MREIKIRVTRKALRNGKIFHEYYNPLRESVDLWEGNTYKILGTSEFTGLKDKNGKDIYEGDILSHNDNKFVVKMSDNLFVFVLSVIVRPTNWRDLAWCNSVGKYIEIIGNIHENPELLK